MCVSFQARGSDPASRGEGLLVPRRAMVAGDRSWLGEQPLECESVRRGLVGSLVPAVAAGEWPREAALRGGPEPTMDSG